MRPTAPPPDPTERAAARPSSPTALAAAFAALGLQAFGGALAVAARNLCDRRRWLTTAQFLDLLAMGQILPGPNVINMAVLFGEQSFGLRGALAAVGGLVLVPLVVALAVTEAYTRLATVPAVAGAVRGMGAVAIGLIAGTALKLTGALRESPLGVPASVGVGAVAFVMVGVLRLPLVAAVVGLGAAACLLAWFRLGGRRGEAGR